MSVSRINTAFTDIPRLFQGFVCPSPGANGHRDAFESRVIKARSRNDRRPRQRLSITGKSTMHASDGRAVVRPCSSKHYCQRTVGAYFPLGQSFSPTWRLRNMRAVMQHKKGPSIVLSTHNAIYTPERRETRTPRLQVNTHNQCWPRLR